MRTNKEQLQEAIAAAGGLHSLRVGSRLFLFDEDSRRQVEKQATQYAIRSGEMIYRGDGVCQFYKWSPIECVGQSGSDRFVWHEDGNRVRQVLQRVTVTRGHEPVCVPVREAFRSLEII